MFSHPGSHQTTLAPLSAEARELLGRFTSSLNRQRPSIDDFLASCPHDQRSEVLDVLVHAELVCRLRAGEPARVEDYLTRYPEIADRPFVVADLVAAELRLRRGEPGHDPAEYTRRFPQHAALVEKLERELGEKSTVTQVLDASPPTAPAPDEPASPRANAVPGYEILEELGRGGMGVVYKARQVRLNRIVALKMILGGSHTGPEERVRFLAEAEMIAAVNHPGIVQIHQFGTHDGLLFFSLEYCPGSLTALLASGPLLTDDAARLIERMARAVHRAHEHGIVHRDLKPSNVLLSDEGSPKITDFGLAKHTRTGDGLTRNGAIVGTPSYMAPEQAEGKREVGPAADVYALGAILYECLTGRPPFKSSTPFDTIRLVIGAEPMPPRRLNALLPRDLETICLQCLQKEPAQRYGSAAELADDLERFRKGELIRARPVGVLERGWRWSRRNRDLASAVSLASCALACSLVLSVIFALSEARNHEQLRRERSRHAVDVVSTLLSADPRAVPGVLDLVAAQPEDVLPRLRQVWNEPSTPLNLPRRMRAALALLPVEEDLVRDALVGWMLEVPDPAELLMVRAVLRPHAARVRADLWRQLEQTDIEPPRRLRLLAALADFDPQGAGWELLDAGALAPWLADNPHALAAWTEALRPAHNALLRPLTEVFQGALAERVSDMRSAATGVLADYASDHPAKLIDLVAEGNARQFATLLPVLARHRAAVIPLLARELARQAEAGATEESREALARRQAAAGMALLRLGESERVWPLLRHSAYPEARTRLIHRLGAEGPGGAALATRLQAEKDVSIRRALILALGEQRGDQVPAWLRQRLVPLLLRWYEGEPDAGIHAAIDWLLRHRKEGPNARPLDWAQAGALARIDTALPGRQRGQRAGHGWYVNGQGQTLAVVEAPEPFPMGSPPDEAGRSDGEKLHWRRIGRRFALGTKAVTVAEFERFLEAHPEVKHSCTRALSPEPGGPIIDVTWHEAAQYCRWLSEQEGVPENEMVYPSVAEIEKSKDGVTPLRLPADHLKRRGYRLPTGAEHEYACRAGARTSRYYGSSLDLLPRYAWYIDNAKGRAWPVGQHKPNDLGLFDMHGHACWCQESSGPYPAAAGQAPAEDSEDRRDILDGTERVLRGASFHSAAVDVRSAFRNSSRPSTRQVTVGLRVARTCD
jgi:serine/threonine protein kinase/formylglycine-generating enzyme required for sulfatase activity